MDKDKEFIEWLKSHDFFDGFVKSHPDRICWITCEYIYGRGYDVRVWYNPKEPKEINPNWEIEQDYSWMAGYGDHGIAACETLGISPYAKYINQNLTYTEGQDKTWEEVYMDWKSEMRDKKLSNIFEK